MTILPLKVCWACLVFACQIHSTPSACIAQVVHSTACKDHSMLDVFHVKTSHLMISLRAAAPGSSRRACCCSTSGKTCNTSGLELADISTGRRAGGLQQQHVTVCKRRATLQLCVCNCLVKEIYVANLERFNALFKCLMPPWLKIRSCCIFDLAHADKMGAISLQVCFLQVHKK